MTSEHDKLTVSDVSIDEARDWQYGGTRDAQAALEMELDRWVAREQEIDRSDMTRPRMHSCRRDKVTGRELGYLTGHVEGLAKALRTLETGDTHGWEQHVYASLDRVRCQEARNS